MNDIRNSGGTPPSRNFRLDKGNAKLAGVCSGIGNYFNRHAVRLWQPDPDLHPDRTDRGLSAATKSGSRFSGRCT